MRQRKIKGLTKENIKDLGVIVEPRLINLKGEVHLEVGSGKGQFITKMATDFKDKTFIAFEKNINVAIRIIEKVNELNLENVIVILDDANNLLEYISQNSVDILYLNFSDPWPKPRHHKRRLTYPSFLKVYQQVLKTSGLIQLRTDHYDLFIDSVEYFKSYFELVEVNYNYKSNQYFTEYEEKRLERGNLYQLKGKMK